MNGSVRRLTLARAVTTFGIAVLGVTLVMLAAVCVGSSTNAIGFPHNDPSGLILGDRLSHASLAAIVGLGLGVAGAAYQAVLRNDLADPYLLGVASGAALGAYLWRLPIFAATVALLGPVGAMGQPTFSFAGALAAATIVLIISGGARGRADPDTVVLVGVVVSTLCGAIMMLIFTFAKAMPGAAGSLQSVLIGELQTSLSRAQFWTATTIVLLSVIALTLRSPHLNVASLGEDEARSLGLRIARERLIALAVASLATAAAVSVSGPIGFVGLIAPHAARRIVGVDNRLSLPVSAAAGAILLMIADAVLRLLAGTRAVNTIVPIGVATAMLGAPFFLLLLLRQRRRGGAS